MKSRLIKYIIKIVLLLSYSILLFVPFYHGVGYVPGKVTNPDGTTEQILGKIETWESPFDKIHYLNPIASYWIISAFLILFITSVVLISIPFIQNKPNSKMATAGDILFSISTILFLSVAFALIFVFKCY